MKANDPSKVNCSPELGAAAMVVVKLGANSYRQGKVYHFNPETLEYSDGNDSWAKQWEQMSYDRADAKHVAGWHAGDKGSKLIPPGYQKLEGPWIDGKDPARTASKLSPPCGAAVGSDIHNTTSCGSSSSSLRPAQRPKS